MAKHETHCWEKDAWKQLEANARANSANGIHLVDLMQDNKRCAVMAEEFSGVRSMYFCDAVFLTFLDIIGLFETTNDVG